MRNLDSFKNLNYLFLKKESKEEILFYTDPEDFLDLLMSESGDIDATGFFSGIVMKENVYYLWRDPIGASKLYFSILDSGELIYSNSWVSILSMGIDVKRINAVPKGKLLIFEKNKFVLVKKIKIPKYNYKGAIAGDLNERISFFFEEFKNYIQTKKKNNKNNSIYLALSGGLDSSYLLLRAVKKHLNIKAITINLPGSKDALLSKEIAKKLNCKHLIIDTNKNQILDSLLKAPLFCDDWRDFNVHCAAINMLIGQNIIGKSDKEVFLITGDFMNEYVCDYQEETFEQKTYYKLPKVSVKKLQQYLVSGLETSAREDVVFSKYNINTIQPYSLVYDIYSSLNTEILLENDVKKKINLVEEDKWILDFISSEKLRAQVGDKDSMGILGLAIENKLSDDSFLEIISKKTNQNPTCLKTLIFAGKFKTINIS